MAEIRNYRIETISSATTTATLPDGSTVEVPSHSHEASVHDEKCPVCGEWSEVVGVIGALKRMGLGCPKCGALT